MTAEEFWRNLPKIKPRVKDISIERKYSYYCFKLAEDLELIFEPYNEVIKVSSCEENIVTLKSHNYEGFENILTITFPDDHGNSLIYLYGDCKGNINFVRDVTSTDYFNQRIINDLQEHLYTALIPIAYKEYIECVIEPNNHIEIRSPFSCFLQEAYKNFTLK